MPEYNPEKHGYIPRKAGAYGRCRRCGWELVVEPGETTTADEIPSGSIQCPRCLLAGKLTTVPIGHG